MHATILLATAGLLAGPAAAQAPAARPTRPAVAAPKTAAPPAARTAKSLACSGQADAKGLHGGQRKHFMATCKKA